MRVVLASAAAQDLEAIADHIAEDSPRRAISFVRELRASARALGQMPRAYPLVPRYEHAGIRRKVHRDYLIFYRVDADRIIVIHILHGARDYEAILFPPV